MDPARDAGDALAERYGRTTPSRRRGFAFAVATGAAAVAAAIAWVFWVGALGPGAALETRDTGFEVAADGSVEIRFDVTTDPGNTVRCALQALNPQFAIVGWRVVDLPPGDERTRTFAETVRTTETPTTGLIYRCWLT